MFGNIAQMLSVGKCVTYNNEYWLIVNYVGVSNDNTVYLAVRANELMPAVVHMISVKTGTELKNAADVEDDKDGNKIST